MKVPSVTVWLTLGVLAGSAAPSAQIGQVLGGLQKAKEVKDAIDSLVFTDAEEQQLGEEISQKLREKYGVVQDKAVHKYITLLGTTLAQASSRPNIKWTFIVLDTDGVNAFAAPGGFVHVTRGALALAQNEAETAAVLGHEITHITAKHTIRAIQKNKAVQVGASAARSAILNAVASKGYEMLLENDYNRDDETEADRVGTTLANSLGYAPNGIATFLTRLADRNKDLKEKSGLFASHPQTKDRIDAVNKLIASQKLTGKATVDARFHAAIGYKPVAVTAIAASAGGAAGLTESKASDKTEKNDGKAADKNDKKAGPGKFGLGGLNPLGREKASQQTVASAGSRGVNPDRDARGGSNSAIVPTTVTPAELAEFRKGIA